MLSWPMQPCETKERCAGDERARRQGERADGSGFRNSQRVACNRASGLVSGSSGLACRLAIRSSRLGSSRSSSVNAEDKRLGFRLLHDLRHDGRVARSSRSSSGLGSRLTLCVVRRGTWLDTFDSAAVAVLDVSDYSQPQSRGLVLEHSTDRHKRHGENPFTCMVYGCRVTAHKTLIGKRLSPDGHLVFKTINERMASVYAIPLPRYAAVQRSAVLVRFS
jgi:hypothetical protein